MSAPNIGTLGLIAGAEESVYPGDPTSWEYATLNGTDVEIPPWLEDAVIA
ncbi:MAG: hypothetical protein ACJ79V_01555 [Myxococcales bacterium]